MTEEEQLKRNAAAQKAQQQFEEVSAYFDSLVAAAMAAIRREAAFAAAYALAFAGLWVAVLAVGVGAAPEWVATAANFAFLLAMVLSFTATTRRVDAVAEFVGVVRVLRMLGMLPPAPPEAPRRRRRVWREGVDMVREWAAKRKAAQERVWQPA
jgi:ABC-type multidrug transport system fused ATPase/permease subunit